MKKVIMKRRTALVLGIIFLILISSVVFLYVNKNYQKEYENPPILIVFTEDGREVEMLPIQYEWTYKGETKKDSLEGELNELDFSNHTILVSTRSGSHFTKSNVSYKTKAGFYERYKIENGELISTSSGGFNRDISKLDYIVSDSTPVGENIEVIEIRYAKQGYVRYAIKKIAFKEELSKNTKTYINTSLEDEEKVKELVQKLEVNNFLQDVKIEKNNLNLKYEFHIDKDVLKMNNLILFACIPDLQTITYTAEYEKTFHYDSEKEEYVKEELSEKVYKRDDVNNESLANTENLFKYMEVLGE